MNPAPTFDRVYTSLRALIMSGRFRPGARLEPVHIGDELRASITPVRDALYRLIGEGLVDPGDTDGFAVSPVTETDLRDLYRWNRQLLVLALRQAPVDATAREMPDAETTDVAARTAALFSAIVHHGDSGEHSRAVDRVSNRLHAVRLVELLVAEIGVASLEELADTWAFGSVADVRRQVTSYHQRRLHHVAAIVTRLRSP